MKTFHLSASVTVSAYTQVRAETLEEAIQIAEGRDVVLDFNGSGESPSESWCISEPDGSPDNIKDQG